MSGTGDNGEWKMTETKPHNATVDIDEARKYLETGGLGEVEGLARMAIENGEAKVTCDADMAVALCQLAAIGIAAL